MAKRYWKIGLVTREGKELEVGPLATKAAVNSLATYIFDARKNMDTMIPNYVLKVRAYKEIESGGDYELREEWNNAHEMNASRILMLSAGAWDYDNEFRVQGVSGNVSLHKDYKKQGDGIYWGMQHGACIKSSYSREEIEHTDRMRKFHPIADGETVWIYGKTYKARVIGNYSDCVVFDPVGE